VQFVVEFWMNSLREHKFYKHMALGFRKCEWSGVESGDRELGRARWSVKFITDWGKSSRCQNGSTAKNLCKFFNFQHWCPGPPVCVCVWVSVNPGDCAFVKLPATTIAIPIPKAKWVENQSPSSNTISQKCTGNCRTFSGSGGLPNTLAQ